MKPVYAVVVVLLFIFFAILAFWYFWTRALNKEMDVYAKNITTSQTQPAA